MKIITLNTWGGRAGKDQLLSFFKTHAESTDIFCLQEVHSASLEQMNILSAAGQSLSDSSMMTRGLQDVSDILPGHQAYFRPHLLGCYGLLMLVKKDLIVREEGEVFVYKQKGYVPEGDVANHARNIQYVTLEIGNELLTIINFHGLWNGKGKTDTEDRLQQSKNILDFMRTLNGKRIICGDFNLLPDTQSIQMFERAGFKNLIKEFGITSTRTSFYTKPEKYADYIFVTSNIKINRFTILSDEVSDHAALLVDID